MGYHYTKKTIKIILITSIIISFVVFSSSFFMEWESYRKEQKFDIFDTLQDDDSHKKEAPQGVEKFLVPVPEKQVPEELNKREQHKVAPPKGLTLVKEPPWWHRAIKAAISNAVVGFLIAFFVLLVMMDLPRFIDNAIPKVMNYTKNKGLRRANLALSIVAYPCGFLWGLTQCNKGWSRDPIEVCIFAGFIGAIIFSLSTLIGVWGIIYLASWVYEGFKEEKTPPGKRSPATRKK